MTEKSAKRRLSKSPPGKPPQNIWALIEFLDTQEDKEPEDEELLLWLIDQASRR